MGECEHTWYWDGENTHCYKCKVRILDQIAQVTRKHHIGEVGCTCWYDPACLKHGVRS